MFFFPSYLFDIFRVRVTLLLRCRHGGTETLWSTDNSVTSVNELKYFISAVTRSRKHTTVVHKHKTYKYDKLRVKTKEVKPNLS